MAKRVSLRVGARSVRMSDNEGYERALSSEKDPERLAEAERKSLETLYIFS